MCKYLPHAGMKGILANEAKDLEQLCHLLPPHQPTFVSSALASLLPSLTEARLLREVKFITWTPDPTPSPAPRSTLPLAPSGQHFHSEIIYFKTHKHPLLLSSSMETDLGVRRNAGKMEAHRGCSSDPNRGWGPKIKRCWWKSKAIDSSSIIKVWHIRHFLSQVICIF